MNVHEVERAILVKLFDSLGGASWDSNENWLTREPVGEWYGIRTNDAGRVVAIELGKNGLRGSIPPELGGLSVLELLQLFENEITGEIPPALGRLPRLRALSLYRNKLRGPLPAELGDLSALRELMVHDNALDGRIPDRIGCLPALRWISLSNNCFHGPLPELAELKMLNAFFMSGNAGLCGELPMALSSFSSLQYISFDRTQLQIPAGAGFRQWLDGITNYSGAEWNAASDREALIALYEATGGPAWKNRTRWLSDAPLGEWHGVRTNAAGRVERLLLGDNNLVGAGLCELGRLSELKELRLDHNRLSGQIPPSLGSLVRLNALDLSHNRLTGTVPPELGELHELTVLALGNNPLSGATAASDGSFPKLRELWLGNSSVSVLPRLSGVRRA